METKFIKALVSLGVPGVALGVFYLLLRQFNFQFSRVGTEVTALVIVFFLLVVGGVTAYALHLWRPDKSEAAQNPKKSGPMVLNIGEEQVILSDLMRSLGHDVVKVDAHTHPLGVAAEYEWIRRAYPKSKVLRQAVKELQFKRMEGSTREVFFDVINIQLEGGRQKQVYFDISSFFDGAGSHVDPDSHIGRKLTEIYGQ